jgi:hypothetical protein
VAEWLLAVTDLATVNKLFLEGSDLEVTRDLNGGMSMTFGVEARDAAIAELTVGRRAVKAYRNGVLRVHGRVWEPVRYGPEMVHFEVRDPWAVVRNRRVRDLVTYTATDAGDIAWALIALQNGYKTTRLREGANANSVNRDRTYDPGKLVGEAVEQLAGVINGFWFRVDPVDGVAGTQAELVVLHPASGATKNVLFEFGDDTTGGLEGFELQVLLPRNRVVARGGEGTVPAVAEDAASILANDLYEDEVSFTDVTVQTTLQQHADAELRANPIKTFTFDPGPTGPMLWDDFDVGDIVGFRIENGSLIETGTGRVTSASVSVGNGGAESLSKIVLEQVT